MDEFDQIWAEESAAIAQPDMPSPGLDMFDSIWAEESAKLARPAQSTKDKIASGILTAGSSALLGFGDEIAAAGNALIDEGKELFGMAEPATYGERYDKWLGAARGAMGQFAEENPKTAFGLEIGGGIATGGIGAAKTGVFKAPSLIRGVTRGAGVGAGTGAVAGFGYGEGGVGNRSINAAQGAGIGAIFGAGIGGLSESIAKLGRTRTVANLRTRFGEMAADEVGAVGNLGDAPEKLTNAQKSVLKIFESATDDELLRAAQRMEQAQATNTPITLFEALDVPQGYIDAKAVRVSRGGRDVAEGFLQDRRKNTSFRIGQVLDDIAPEDSVYGGSRQLQQGAEDIVEGYKTARSTATEPLYRAAREEAPIIESDTVNEILELPVAKDIIADRRTKFATEIPEPGAAKTTPFIDAEPSRIPLSPDEAAVETRAFNRMAAEGQDLVDDYLARSTDARGNISLDVDEARSLVSNSTLAKGTHEPASALNKAAYRQIINDPDTPDAIRIISGGPDSGKSTAREVAIDGRPYVNSEKIIKSEQQGTDMIEDILASGKKAQIVHVDIDPEVALERAWYRALKTGRAVPIENFESAGNDSSKAIIQLANKYSGNDNVKITILDNSINGAEPKPITLAQLNERRYNINRGNKPLSDVLSDKLETLYEQTKRTAGSQEGISRATEAYSQFKAGKSKPGLGGVQQEVTGGNQSKLPESLARQQASQIAGVPDNDIRVLDQLKRGLGDEIEKAKRAGANDLAREYARIQKRLTDEIDNYNPAYKEARDVYTKLSRPLNRIEGQKFGGKRTVGLLEDVLGANPEKAGMAAKRLIEKSPDQLKAIRQEFVRSGNVEDLRAGVRAAFQGELEKVNTGVLDDKGGAVIDRIFGKNNTRAKLESLLGKDETDRIFTKIDLEGLIAKGERNIGVDLASVGSPTQQLQQAVGEQKGIMRVLTQSPLSTIREVFEALRPGEKEDFTRELAQELFSTPDPKKFNNLIQLQRQYNSWVRGVNEAKNIGQGAATTGSAVATGRGSGDDVFTDATGQSFSRADLNNESGSARMGALGATTGTGGALGYMSTAPESGSLYGGKKKVDSKQREDLAVDLVKKFEGKRLSTYKDVGDVPTIGYGHTGEAVKKGKITDAEATKLLREDIKKFESAVDESVNVSLTEPQRAALVSLAYNIGEGAFKRSTLLKKLNDGDIEGAADEFLRWNKVDGEEVRGLTNRRKQERDIFLT